MFSPAHPRSSGLPAVIHMPHFGKHCCKEFMKIATEMQRLLVFSRYSEPG